MIWFSGGLYHIVVNSWSARKAYHLTSTDGKSGWTFRGLAYDPTTDFVRYSDGTVNHWEKMERPGVLLEEWTRDSFHLRGPRRPEGSRAGERRAWQQDHRRPVRWGGLRSRYGDAATSESMRVSVSARPAYRRIVHELRRDPLPAVAGPGELAWPPVDVFLALFPSGSRYAFESASKVCGKNAHVHSEIVSELAYRLPAERLLTRSCGGAGKAWYRCVVAAPDAPHNRLARAVMKRCRTVATETEKEWTAA